jgi:tripartite-type tricarboxylate transporter receptor subunit TctC
MVGLAACASCATALAADAYPVRPITIVVGFAPGGITDIFARALGQEASRILKQPVIVDNKPGAAGMIASDMVARATPDGYTLLMTANNHTINPALRPKGKVDAVNDFTPITLLASTPNVLVVPNSSPYKTLRDFVCAAKAKPGAVSYGTSGVGTAPHFTGEHFATVIGSKFIHVPYKGSNQSLMAAISGEVDSAWSAAALQQIKSGNVRALGVASEKRFSLAPNIPTFAEQGFKGFQGEVWVGLLGPARPPKDISEKWNSVLQHLLTRTDMQEKVRGQGYEAINGVALEIFKQRIAREVSVYRKVAAEANIQPE